jgi:hypothetical protein
MPEYNPAFALDDRIRRVGDPRRMAPVALDRPQVIIRRFRLERPTFRSG